MEVVYDEALLPTAELLDCYYLCIDPTSVNKQGEDEGEQYRTGIYYTDLALLPAIRASLDRLAAQYDKPLAIQLEPLAQFFPAEDYHQDYLIKNPNGYCHIPRDLIKKVRRRG